LGLYNKRQKQHRRVAWKKEFGKNSGAGVKSGSIKPQRESEVGRPMSEEKTRKKLYVPMVGK
jgi:hypothetical protein